MTLEDRIKKDLITAMKAKDKIALRGIRAIKAAILLANTDGSGEQMTEEKGIKLLQKLVKQRRDSVEIFEKESRDDLAQTEKEEIAIIEKYLPEQLSPEKLEEELKKIMAAVGATSMKDMGKIMGAATKQLAGRADGKSISSKIKELLNS